MDKIELAERHYNTFINQENTANFFRGMVDYLDFLDSTPAFEAVLARLINTGKALEMKREEFGKILIIELDKIKERFERYITEKDIKNDVITNVLEEYEDRKMEKIVGSQTIPNALHDGLCRILHELKQLPGNLDFIAPYCEFFNDDPSGHVKYFLPFKEYNEYRAVHEQFEYELETTLWGQLGYIISLYEGIKQGRSKMKELSISHKNKPDIKTSWEMINFGTLFSEWSSIEKDQIRDIYFYRILKVKPWLIRLHNHVLTQLALNPPNVSPLFEKYDNKRHAIYIGGKEIVIGKNGKENNAALLLKTLTKESGKEYFEDEVLDDWGNQDFDIKNLPRLQVYQAAKKINDILKKEAQISDFIVHTTKKFRVNPTYLKSL